jgi:hypothetical protein
MGRSEVYVKKSEKGRKEGKGSADRRRAEEGDQIRSEDDPF